MLDFDVIFKNSYERVLGKQNSQKNEFFTSFYERFIDSSPLVAEKFKYIDMQAQKVMLKQSIFHLLNLFSTRKIPKNLKQIAQKHDRNHADISPDLYYLWQECLIETVAEFDEKFSTDVELAWRLVCSQGIAFMNHVHRQSSK